MIEVWKHNLDTFLVSIQQNSSNERVIAEYDGVTVLSLRLKQGGYCYSGWVHQSFLSYLHLDLCSLGAENALNFTFYTFLYL